MASSLESPTPVGQEPQLGQEFTRRLEVALRAAERDRRRRAALLHLRSLLPFVLLLAPIVGWRLILATPDGVHVGIGVLAWLTFMLDVGVHVDTTVLSYLGLQALPSVVGALLLILVTGWLLSTSSRDS